MSEKMVETSADVRRHELLADVAERVGQVLIDNHGLSDEIGVDVGNAIADFLADHWCGQIVYITADTPFKLDKRDHDIFQRMRRGNAHELAREFGISYVRVYQIYKRCLAAARKRNQPALFADPEPGLEPCLESELSTGKKRLK